MDQIQNQEVESASKPTSRLRVVTLDWPNITARSLYIYMCVHLGSDSQDITSITVYPSENRINCMLQESDGENGIDEQRYYYAVVVCDSPATASYLHTILDGTLIGSEPTRLDLRFIDDSVEFKQPQVDFSEELVTDLWKNCYCDGNPYIGEKAQSLEDIEELPKMHMDIAMELVEWVKGIEKERNHLNTEEEESDGQMYPLPEKQYQTEDAIPCEEFPSSEKHELLTSLNLSTSNPYKDYMDLSTAISEERNVF